MFIPFHDENPTTHYPVVTYLLVALNVLVFIASRQLSERDWQLLVYRWGFIPARIAQLKTHQPVVVHVQEVVKSPIFGPVEVRRPLQLKAQPGKILFSLITCMFLHGGWLHLIFNMWFLLLFGNSVEDRLGPLLFLVLFFGGGLIAGASQWLVEPRSMIPMIGASGAVAAILGAYTVTWPWARVHTFVFLVFFITIVEVPALVVNGLWFVAQIIAGHDVLHSQAPGGVASWAHVGGFVAGMVIMPALIAISRRQNPRPESSDNNEAMN